MWAVAALAGLIVVATGVVDGPSALAVLREVGPVLGFLAAITVVAELADAAGVFDAAAHVAARAGRGSVRLLFALVLVLAFGTTLVLSLDTTAVLLTPVVLVTARRLAIPALPFAMATVWLANTASLLLPISNLTNLLAMNRLGLSVTGFARHMWLPALAAFGVTALVLGVRYRKLLTGGYVAPHFEPPPDRTLFRISALTCAVLGPLFVAGADVPITAGLAAVFLIVVFAVRRPRALVWSLVPWRLVLLVSGLFLVVRAGQDYGLGTLLTHAAGTSGSAPGLLRVASVAALAANLVNNLPAFAALSPVAGGSVPRTLAVLIGTNLGPLVLLWGSLATLLWRERCEAMGLKVSAREFAMVGLAGVPILLTTATLSIR
ncbi:MAG: SLC13 family permease [Actinocrinis sp.]